MFCNEAEFEKWTCKWHLTQFQVTQQVLTGHRIFEEVCVLMSTSQMAQGARRVTARHQVEFAR